MANVLRLDVSALEPPEPLEQILAALRSLPADTALRVNHRREPLPLYPLLAELHFAHHCWLHSDGSITLYIWPADNPALASYCQEGADAH